MKRRLFKDRKDGRRIDHLSGMGQIILDLKPKRCDSYVFINQEMDLTTLTEYIEKKKDNGVELTFFHAFVTAIGKTFYNRPKLNYFVANRHLYEHNDIVVSFVDKVAFDDHSEEMMIMIPILPNDNIYTTSKRIKEKVKAIRDNSAKKEGANSAIDILGRLPNIIRVPLVGIFKCLDRKGHLPNSLIKDNLYYSSIIVSNLGSIHCGAIHHNITDFGSCSSLATMGEIKDEEKIIDGKKVILKICDFGINFDERVADGYYFAKSIKLIQYLFLHPEELESDVSEKIDVPLK